MAAGGDGDHARRTAQHADRTLEGSHIERVAMALIGLRFSGGGGDADDRAGNGAWLYG